MLTDEQAKITALRAVAKLLGEDYLQSRFKGSCHSYTPWNKVNVNFDYFIGFEGV